MLLGDVVGKAGNYDFFIKLPEKEVPSLLEKAHGLINRHGASIILERDVVLPPVGATTDHHRLMTAINTIVHEGIDVGGL